MPSVSSIAGSQQQYFAPTAQNQTKPAAANQASTNQASTNPASASQPLTSSAPAQTAAAPAATPPPPSSSGGTAAKIVESAATRNGDGTFGPRHTRQPPLSYRLLHQTAKPAKVDVKA